MKQPKRIEIHLHKQKSLQKAEDYHEKCLKTDHSQEKDEHHFTQSKVKSMMEDERAERDADKRQKRPRKTKRRTVYSKINCEDLTFVFSHIQVHKRLSTLKYGTLIHELQQYGPPGITQHLHQRTVDRWIIAAREGKTLGSVEAYLHNCNAWHFPDDFKVMLLEVVEYLVSCASPLSGPLLVACAHSIIHSQTPEGQPTPLPNPKNSNMQLVPPGCMSGWRVERKRMGTCMLSLFGKHPSQHQKRLFQNERLLPVRHQTPAAPLHKVPKLMAQIQCVFDYSFFSLLPWSTLPTDDEHEPSL